MLSKLVIPLLFGSAPAARSNPLHNLDSSLTLSSASNASEGFAARRPIVQCDTAYGENLNVLDCRNAIFHINRGDQPRTVLSRDDREPGDDDSLPLPFRLMGSKSSTFMHWEWLNMSTQLSFILLDTDMTLRLSTVLYPACFERRRNLWKSHFQSDKSGCERSSIEMCFQSQLWRHRQEHRLARTSIFVKASA